MWPLNPALGRFVWTRHGSMLSSVVRQESGNMCRALCRLVYSPDPVYAWPLVTMVAQSSLPNIFLCSFRAEARGQHGDVVGPGMSGLLGSARTLLQEYAVKGALLCTAGKQNSHGISSFGQ